MTRYELRPDEEEADPFEYALYEIYDDGDEIFMGWIMRNNLPALRKALDAQQE